MPRMFSSSTLPDFQPRYSPDGTKIAFGSFRSGPREIWIADADGSNPVPLTSFGGPLVGFMNWSPDGQRLVFHARPEGQADLFEIPASGGAPKRLTAHPSDDTLPSYSHDGRWIYFTSRRSGQLEIWKMPAKGGDATQMTRTGGLMPLESPDGKTLYYGHPTREKGIWKVPVEGGEATQVTGPTGGQSAFAVTAEGIYYTAAPDVQSELCSVPQLRYRTEPAGGGGESAVWHGAQRLAGWPFCPLWPDRAFRQRPDADRELRGEVASQAAQPATI